MGRLLGREEAIELWSSSSWEAKIHYCMYNITVIDIIYILFMMSLAVIHKGP